MGRGVYYRVQDCVETFCTDIKRQADKIINYEKKETIPLTDEETESYENQRVCYIRKK